MDNKSEIKASIAPEIKPDLDLKKIILLQKCFRGYLVRKKLLIPSSYYQTKEWRKSRSWYNNGKQNECEKYQIDLIQKMVKLKLNKTDERINMESNEIICKKNPMVNDNGYEWTENFDGKISIDDTTYYFNLKFVCDSGGAQTRTLREVYNFIRYQLEYLLKFNRNNVYFINILDGDTSHNNNSKFIYLINKEQYKDIKKYIFIGSLFNFQQIKEKIMKKN